MEKKSRTSLGRRGVKRRPTSPERCFERREVWGAGSSSGVVPRALAITFVLPKKSLFDWRMVRLSSQATEMELMSEGTEGRNSEPAVRELGADVFEVGVAHVVDGEYKDVGVLVEAGADVGVELEGKVFAFFGGFGRVHHFRALGFGHFAVGGGLGCFGWSFISCVRFIVS